MALSPVTLAEWVNADHCPQKALNEAERLSIELGLAEKRVQVGGTDVRWAGAEDYRRSLYRLEVNAASIQCCWQTKQLTEAWDAADPADLSGVAAWWNSLPLKERPIHEPGCRDPYCETCDVKFDALPRPKRVIKTDRTPLRVLFRRWKALPAGGRPDFPLDPVVQSWTGGELSAENYNGVLVDAPANAKVLVVSTPSMYVAETLEGGMANVISQAVQEATRATVEVEYLVGDGDERLQPGSPEGQ